MKTNTFCYLELQLYFYLLRAFILNFIVIYLKLYCNIGQVSKPKPYSIIIRIKCNNFEHLIKGLLLKLVYVK